MRITVIKLSAVFISLFLVLMLGDNTSAQQKETYIVQSGDTFYSISKKLDVTVAELKEWNSINTNTLAVNQELVYYVAETSDSSVQLPDDAPALITTETTSKNTYYLVKSGDTLYQIARDNNMSINELKALNNITSDNLRIGQKLAVKSVSVAPVVSEFSEDSSPQGTFALYTLKRSDNLSTVLSRFKMTETELKALNPQTDINNLSLAKNITVLMPPSKEFANPYLEKADLQDLGSVSTSIYSDSEVGNTTTNGELYNPNKLSAAHSNITIGTVIFVENPQNGKGIYVRVNDRIVSAGLKLSHAAYRILGINPEQPQEVTIYTDS